MRDNKQNQTEKTKACGEDSCSCDQAYSQESLLSPEDGEDISIARRKRQLVLGGSLFVVGFLLHLWEAAPPMLSMGILMVAYIVLGLSILIRAIKNIRAGQLFDENFLMSVATIGALAIGQWAEAVAVVLFYQVGELFQSMAVHRSKRSIKDLLAIRPDYANIMRDGTLVMVEPEAVAIGDLIVVKPGEKVPLDGIVASGSSMVDTSALTGESMLREVDAGDVLLSGCVNKDGVLTVKVTAAFGASTASKIIDMVTQAGDRKTQSENFITRFAKIYTPIVVIAAVLLAIVPPLLGMGEFSLWFYRALSFLVISCPCALVISIPLGYFGGIGATGRRGILVKGSNYLDALSRVDTVVFDKTGTLTQGKFQVSKIVALVGTEEEVLRLAAIAEQFSDHPIALSVKVKAQNMILPVEQPENYKELTGRGVLVTHEGKEILVGNKKLMEEMAVSQLIQVTSGGAILYVALNKSLIGYIELRDEVKPEAAGAIAQLKALRVKKVIMLTGDRQAAANLIADQLGISQVYAEQLPIQKLETLEAILQDRQDKTNKTPSGAKGKSQDNKLVYVGDGINDAPVLARADVGVAIGAMASGAAIEAADVVVMTDDLRALPQAIQIAKKTRRIVSGNIVFALLVKGVILVLASAGLTNLWVAIFADVGVSIIAILNAMRAGK